MQKPPVSTHEGQLPGTPLRQRESYRIYDALARHGSPAARWAWLAYLDVLESVTSDETGAAIEEWNGSRAAWEDWVRNG